MNRKMFICDKCTSKSDPCILLCLSAGEDDTVEPSECPWYAHAAWKELNEDEYENLVKNKKA